METGTIYFYGQCDNVELVVIDTDSDYEEVVKIYGEIVSVIPDAHNLAYCNALQWRTRITKEVAIEWLNH